MNLKKWFIRLFIAGFAVILALAGINLYVKITSNPYCFRSAESLPDSRVAVIFGAGIRNNAPSKYLKDRLDAGIRAYKEGKARKLLLSGDNGSKSYDELAVMKTYCADHGVDTLNIFVDYAGFDTYSTLYRAKYIFGVQEAVLVTQNYHLDRAVFIARHLDIDAVGYAADRGGYSNLRKNKIRELFATVKSFVDVLYGRKPKFLGKKVDLDGKGNFSK
ncbi:MAG: hypothetical protein RLZ62_2267 [Bacteroidota bacterium]|jgi:SanA protein